MKLLHLFGYDYPGGYDRDMGGRPGFPDDRPRGRYGGRGYQSGPSVLFLQGNVQSINASWRDYFW
ncbi:hypothetical protein Hanom_Chr00s000007g01615221 [Helianthus anomalus]